LSQIIIIIVSLLCIAKQHNRRKHEMNVEERTE